MAFKLLNKNEHIFQRVSLLVSDGDMKRSVASGDGLSRTAKFLKKIEIHNPLGVFAEKRFWHIRVVFCEVVLVFKEGEDCVQDISCIVLAANVN